MFVGGILYNTLGDRQGRYARLTDPSVEDDLGNGYLDMIQLAGGISVDLALSTINVAAFDDAIAALGHAVAVQPIREVRHFELFAPYRYAARTAPSMPGALLPGRAQGEQDRPLDEGQLWPSGTEGFPSR